MSLMELQQEYSVNGFEMIDELTFRLLMKDVIKEILNIKDSTADYIEDEWYKDNRDFDDYVYKIENWLNPCIKAISLVKS